MKAGDESGNNRPPKSSKPATAAPALAIPYPPGLSWRVGEDEPQPVPHFTQRQKEVGSWLGEGFTDGEIAGELGISLHTVKAHVTELLERTKTPGRGRLQAWIWRNRMAFELAQRSPAKPVKYK